MWVDGYMYIFNCIESTDSDCLSDRFDQMQEGSMKDEYPAPEEVKKEGDMEETVQTEEINRDDADEEMNFAMDEEHFDDICEYLEDDAYPDADVYIGKQAYSSLNLFGRVLKIQRLTVRL